MIRFEPDNSIARFERWTDEQKQAVHDTAVRILSQIGTKVLHEEARELLRSAGAQVDDEIVRIPSELIEKALGSAPSSYAIYNTDGTEAFTLEPNTVTFGTGTDMPEFIDLYTGEIRPGELKDCENAAKIAQHCKSIDWVAPYALANDKIPESQICIIIKP